MSTQSYRNPYELYHHGVKGMKWGVRKEHQSSDSRKKRSKMEDWSDDAKEANRISKKKVSQMSNAELQQLNNRKNLEQQYSRLNPSTISRGMKYVATAATITGTAITLINNSDKIIKIGKDVVQKIKASKSVL